MNYCKECGKTITKKSDNQFVCTSCGNTYYINPKGATAVLLFDSQNKLVLGRRAHEPQKGKLDCIGGFVDIGENFEVGMIRELKEESGLEEKDIEELKYFGSTYDPYKWQDRIVPTVSVYFKSKLVSDKELHALDDIASFEHIELKDINRNEVAWDGLWEMIEKLKTSPDY